MLITAVEYSFTEEEIAATKSSKNIGVSALHCDAGVHAGVPTRDVGFIYPEGLMIELPPAHDLIACASFRKELLKKDLDQNFLLKGR